MHRDVSVLAIFSVVSVLQILRDSEVHGKACGKALNKMKTGFSDIFETYKSWQSE